MADDTIRVFLACAFPATREACARWLAEETGFEVVARGDGSAAGALRALRPHVVVVDGDPADAAIRDELAEIEREAPGARVLLYSQLPADELSEAAGPAGPDPDGYLPKDAGAERLVAAVRHLAGG